MFGNKTKHRYLPISLYLAGSLMLALIPAFVVGFYSVSKSQLIQEEAMEHKRSEAYFELNKTVSQISNDVVNVANHLASWNETIAQFHDSTYYQYWKDTRIRDTGRLHDVVDEIDLYDESGEALVEGSALSSTILPNALMQPVLIRQAGRVHIIYFHLVSLGEVDDAKGTGLGYIGIRVDINEALTTLYSLIHSDATAIRWNFKEGETVLLHDGIQSAQLKILDSPEIDALTKLVRTSLIEYIIYIFFLLVSIAVLLTISFGRPLRKLAAHIKNVYEQKSDEIPENFQGFIKISEFESVRHAVNDYHDRFMDATATLVQKNEELQLLTYRDTLTGIYNRRAFESHLEKSLESAKHENKIGALCYLDMDQFKIVNDTAGHVAGDELLKQVSSVLHSNIRESDILARLGGDEFGILLEGCDVDKAQDIAEILREAISHLRFSWEEKLFDISVSIGLVPITTDSGTISDVLKSADATCYLAKDLGRNRVQVYQPYDEDLIQRYGEMQWVSRISQALEDGRFELYCQKIVPILNEKLDPHYELLIRMRDNDGKLVPPMAFLPAAERYNLMESIDRWVIHNALMVLRENTLPFGDNKGLITINLSGLSLGSQQFMDFVITEFERSNVLPERICFEITETAAITNLSAATRFISVLRNKGCRFALDDFGSGLSSFGYLKSLQVNYLKIDGHFVKQITDDPINQSIVEAINQIGHAMGILTIAEFVENDQILAKLREIGVNYAQGFGISKPKPLTEYGSLPHNDDLDVTAR